MLVSLGAVNFWLGQYFGKQEAGKKQILWLGIGINILAVAVFKYDDFYLPALNELLNNLGVETAAGGLNILLPLGLSFYIVQGISYLVDVYLKRMEPVSDVGDFLLYTIYFPKLLSGPIERAKTFIAQLENPKPVNHELLTRSLGLILVGAVRKVVFADTLANMIPEQVFLQPGEFTSPVLAGWLLAYSTALYNDFAGYTAIIRGVSLLFGIELSANFKNPYFSRNFTEFWARWHISLSHWLRDYIYFPVSRWLVKVKPNRSHFVHILIPPMITMLISALWHGVSVNMLFWGGLHGVYQVVEHTGKRWLKNTQPDEYPFWRKVSATGVTFFLATIAWLPFRTNLTAAWEFLINMFNREDWRLLRVYALEHYFIPELEWHPWELIYVPEMKMLIPIGLAILVDWLQYIGKDEIMFFRWPRVFRYLFISISLILIFLVSQADGLGPFIYQGF